MLLSIPPRPSGRPRLIAGLSLRAGDPIAGHIRALSLLRADRVCAHFAAIQDETKAKVEVQVLLATDESAEPVHLRFLADARRAAALHGPNIQRVLQVGVTADGHPFVVREAQRGDVLARLLRELRSLSTENAVDVALQVCEALETAHAHGIVHGELDASAVHVTWSAGRPMSVKVAGLGTSRAVAMLSREGGASAPLAGQAPEMRAGHAVDPRTDVWGVGVLLYAMLAGSPPFGTTPEAMNGAASLDEPAMLAGVPDGLAELVDACLARAPARRPQTVAALASRLALFGTRPAFEKRASLLVVDTGPYDAVVLERLVKEAAPSEASIDVSIDVSIETSVAEIAPAVRETPSTPPVSLSLAPPAAPFAAQLASPAPPRASRTMLFVAGACIGFGAIVGALSARMPARVPGGEAVTSQAGPQVAITLPSPHASPALEAAPAAAAVAAGSPALPALAVGDLPAVAVTSPPPPRTGLPSDVKLRAASAPAAAKAPAATPEAAVDPVVRSAAAPIQPQPKAADDDLRRFLDDRR